MKDRTANNLILLVCLVALIILAPLFAQQNHLVADMLLTAIFFCGIFSLEFSTKALKILLPLGMATATTTWLGRFLSSSIVYLMDHITTFLFLVAIVVLMVRHIARSRFVTPTIILSAINGYLLLGILGSVLLAMADRLHGALAAGGGPGMQFPGTALPQFSDFIYFSFVTLTTLGFGDITPVSHFTRALTILIAIAGQMYVAILIAMLVGKFASDTRR